MPIRHNHGVHSKRSSPNVQNSLDDNTDTASSDVSNWPTGKFTLTLDCDRLLKPDTNRPGTYTSKAGGEAAEHLELSTLLSVPIINQVKIKMFHVCGQIEFEEDSCLRTLWGVGDWFVEQYRAMGKSAKYEKSDRVREEDWDEPDAAILVSVNTGSNRELKMYE